MNLLFYNSDSGYSTFLILLLKELDGDINKALRILNTGINGSKKVIPVALYNYLVLSIKEAIIMSNYKSFIEEDGFISVLSMARLERFKLAYVDRQTIIRTFEKYNVKYNMRS